MTYVAGEARQELLDTVAEAIDELAVALAALGEGYELLAEDAGDRLEEQLFRPTQLAYGRAQRTHAEFAERFGLPTRTFSPASPGIVSHDVREFIGRAVEAIEQADAILSELQDSLSPVEVGDPQLRAGLAEVRRMAGELPGRAEMFTRGYGR